MLFYGFAQLKAHEVAKSEVVELVVELKFAKS